MTLRITLYGEPILRTKGKKINVFDDSLRVLVQKMIATMRKANGIGIAAQQIGEALQLCIVDMSECEPDFNYLLDGRKPPLPLIMPMAMINPEIEPADGPKAIDDEGCLSFPGLRGEVKRPEAIRVRFQNPDGGEHLLECDGLFARCIQHEVDHLNGILFIDRMSKKSRRAIEADLKELKARAESSIPAL